MDKLKVSLFFGAGAEQVYGLPSGGKFAIDLFRTPVETDKKEFKKQLEKIDMTSTYASKWLPDNYLNKRVNVFGKGDFEGIVSTSLEYRKDEIISYLDEFDTHVRSLLRNWHISEEDIRSKFSDDTGIEIGDISYNQKIKLNNHLAQQVKLFESEYFSALIKVLELSDSLRLKKIVVALLELLVGSYGQRLISKLNEELFESAPDELSVFDDLTGIFRLDYRHTGQTGMEILLQEEPIPVSSENDLLKIMTELGISIIEDIFSKALDYQGLIDSHYRYLYNPKAHWAKFTRINIFLHMVRRYIVNQGSSGNNKLTEGPGYYHDLLEFSEHCIICAIGTTNYNNFVEQILKGTIISETPVYHLNGSVNEFYDPYRNMILTETTTDLFEEYPHIVVPFIFTQSGIKPLTTITMSKRYVQLYEKFQDSDIICVLGYAFNGDDGHINGLFRSLVDEGKKLAIFHYGSDSSSRLKKEYQNKLRLSSSENLEVYTINENRLVGGKIWWDVILEKHALSQQPNA